MTPMNIPPRDAVLISEVGPRDGLQSVKATMPTADKLRFSAKSGTLEQAAGHDIDVVLVVEMTDEAQTRVRLGPQAKP